MSLEVRGAQVPPCLDSTVLHEVILLKTKIGFKKIHSLSMVLLVNWTHSTPLYFKNEGIRHRKVRQFRVSVLL
jgi:hypothetical protein